MINSGGFKMKVHQYSILFDQRLLVSDPLCFSTCLRLLDKSQGTTHCAVYHL